MGNQARLLNAPPRQLLEIAQDMEKDISPEAPAMRVPRWLKRIPILRSKSARNFTRAVIGILFITYWVSLSIFGDSSTLTSYHLVALLLFVLMAFSWYGIVVDVPVVKLFYFSIGQLLVLSLLIIELVVIGLCIALLITGVSVGDQLSALPIAAAFILILHPINSGQWGYSLMGRRLRVSYARISWATFMTLILVSVLALLIYSASQIPSEGADRGVALTGVGLLVTLSALVLGLLSRILTRKRRYCSSLRNALIHLEVAVRCEQEDSILCAAVLELDACCATGVDTGVRMFATPYESDEMRAVLLASVEQISQRLKFDASDQLQDARARIMLEEWCVCVTRRCLLEFLSTRRTILTAGIDVAA